MNYQIYELIKELKEKKELLDKSIDIQKLKDEIKIYEDKTMSSDFWSDSNSTSILLLLKELNKKDQDIAYINDSYNDINEYIELDNSFSEEEENEIIIIINNLINKIDKLCLTLFFNSEYDSSDAIINIHSGAGGADAQEWTQMLMRLYLRFIQSEGYSHTILDVNQDGIAGIKNCTIKVCGTNAYGMLKSENGVHRLVRKSPFDTSGKRHTSFALVEIIPQLEIEKIDVDEKDLKVETYRASGAGGQHVNTTDSAVRITHIPSGTTVTCQNERSQLKNKNEALTQLYNKLEHLKTVQMKDEISKVKGSTSPEGWGSQIRSYIFHPYQLVKDHRTNIETNNVKKVLDGDIYKFIYAYLSNMADAK